MAQPFGPNHAAVEAFLASTRNYRLYRSLGAPASEPGTIVQVDFDFVAEHAHDRVSPWQPSLSRAEDHLVARLRECDRMGCEMEIRDAVFRANNAQHGEFFDDLLIRLDEQHGGEDGYYRDTHTYPHELFRDLFSRFVVGAALELALSDVDNTPRFFGSILPFWEAGRMPCGWEGEWPEGRLILW